MLVTKKFKFDAAHFLTNYHGKCEKLHGHTYKLQVTVEGDVKEDGMVMDFVELKKIVNERVISKLDHSSLNDTIENPSAENIAIWIWNRLKDISEAKLYEVKVWETATSFVTYRGE
ncbi:6-carboxytetrahydropterin synthase QueD [Patescibacteria group bacterium]